MPKAKKTKKTPKRKAAKSPDSAAGFGKTTASEMSATTRLRNILDGKPIVPILWEMNTHPNIDGYLHIVRGENLIPEGKLEAQVKKLSSGDWRRKGFNAERAFLTYCRDVASTPVLLVGVHPNADEAMWLHVSAELADATLQSSKSKTITVRFPKENVLSKSSKDFSQWRALATHNRPILQVVAEYSLTAHKIREISDLIGSVGSPISFNFESGKVQDFIDMINHLLDKDFLLVKRAYYPECWKLGIGVIECDSSHLSYALYPIKRGTGDLLVKTIKPEPKLAAARSSFTGHYTSNPIYEGPEQYAKKIVFDKTEKLIAAGGLISSNDHLGREAIFDGIHRRNLLRWLGLEKKGSYSIDELERGLTEFFPFYLYLLFFKYIPKEFEQVIQLSLAQQGAVAVEDFEQFALMAGNYDFDAIRNEIFARLACGEKAGLPFPVYSKADNLQIIESALSNMKKNGKSKVDDPYIRPKPERASGASFVWSVYGADEIFSNFRAIYENLPETFDSVVQDSFPKVKSSLKFFDEFNLFICIISTENLGNSMFGEPEVEILCAVMDSSMSGQAKPKIVVLSRDEANSRLQINGFSGSIDGTGFQLKSSSRGTSHHLWKPFPLYSLVKEEMVPRIKKLLAERIS